MTTLNGLVGIDCNLAAIGVTTPLSSQRAVLIHQFDFGPAALSGNIGPTFQWDIINYGRSDNSGVLLGPGPPQAGPKERSSARYQRLLFVSDKQTAL